MKKSFFYILVLILAGCGPVRQKPQDLAGVYKEHCNEQLLDPAEFRDLAEDDGIGGLSYQAIIKANSDCIKGLAAAVEFNARAADANSPDGWREDAGEMGIGAGLMLFLEILFYFIVL